MTGKPTLRIALGGTLAAFFGWLILRQTRLVDIKHIFYEANAAWISAALCAFAAGYACRIERWRLMLLQSNPTLKRRHCVGPFLASFAVNNVLPFRAGDVLRSIAFNRLLGSTPGIVIATLFVERLLDFAMVLLLLGAALCWFGLDAIHFANVGSLVLLGAAALIILLLLFPNLFASLLIAASNVILRVAPRRGLRIRDEMLVALRTLTELAKGKLIVRLMWWSLVIWTAEGCVFWFVAFALPSISMPQASWLALPVGTLATLIPSTPGYVGTFDYFVGRAMSKLGNDIVPATAYALFVHALLWLPPTVLGGLYLTLKPTTQTDALVTRP